MGFVSESLQGLKVGGLAIHTVPFNSFVEMPAEETSDPGLLRRADLERPVLGLVSLGRQIAQFKYDRDNADPNGVTGLIVRKGSSNFY